jgi:hypothetical protein
MTGSTGDGCLFDQFERTDTSPMAYGENVFDFYNRVNRPEWARVRHELENWYSRHPDPSGELRSHFRSERQDQHFGAWWELYMYSFFRQRDYEIKLHPTLPNGRPDFLISRDGAAAYVECKAVIERSRTALESNPDFLLELDIEQEGCQQPSAAKIRESIQDWLRGLNADDEIAARDAGEPPKTMPLEIGYWRLLYTAHPVSPDQRGNYGRLLGLRSQRVAFYDNPGLIKRAVRSKGKKIRRRRHPTRSPADRRAQHGNGLHRRRRGRRSAVRISHSDV